MKLIIDKKPIAISLIVVGFLFVLKFMFPIYKIETNSMINSFPKNRLVLVSKWDDVKVGDVVVYNYNNQQHISRVIAKTGSQIVCEDGKLMVNDELFSLGDEMYEYIVFCEAYVKDSLVNTFEELYPKREYRAVITQNEADSLKIREGILRVKKVIQPAKLKLSEFRTYSDKHWDRDNFGTITVPENSFWLMNDNRVNTNDSRTFGAIEEREIVGKIVYSFN